MNEKLLNKSIDNFRQQLTISFPIVDSAYTAYVFGADSRQNQCVESFEDYFHDWAQANWELLVERIVCSSQEGLGIYGSGSDYELATHSRVFFHSLKPTHEVICISQHKVIDVIENELVDLDLYEFECFVSVGAGWFKITPPFDHVLLNERGVYGGGYRQVVIPLEKVEFSIKKHGE